MKGHLYIQRNKGQLLKNITSRLVDISGGENIYGRKIYAMAGSVLVAELLCTDMVIGADGIMFKGFETQGDRIYYQEWWVDTNHQ